MNRIQNANSKGTPIYGNVLESVMKLNEMIPKNDGVGDFSILSSEAYDKPLPISGQNTETTIQFTTPNHDISQIDDSFFIVDSTAVVSIPELTATAFSGAVPYYCFAFKASNQIFRQMRLLVNGVNTEYLSTECLRESYGFANLKGKAEKTTKKHVYSQYKDAHEYRQGICGVYVPASAFKNSGRVATLTFRFIIPIADILPFQAMPLYPSRILGQLGLKVNFFMQGMVYCQVDPSKILEFNNFMNNAANTLDPMFGSTAFYDRFFTQVGDYGHLLDDDGTASYISARVRPIVQSFSITRLSCQMAGYMIKSESFNAIGQYLQSNPLIVPAQQLQYVSYSTIPNAAGFTGSTPVLFNGCESISVMFPTTTQQMTVFKNPNIQNLQLKIGDKLMPPNPISTNTDVSPEFLAFQLVASDLGGAIEPTESWLYSLVGARTNESGVRYANSREDNTDFMANFAMERSNGGYVMDGFSTNSPVNVELRFNPVNAGANDVYYIPDPADPTAHPIAPELWICNETYFIMSPSGIKYVPEPYRG